jgi:RyR domain-containing protein
VREVDGDVEPVSFSDDEVEVLAELEHDRWTAERLADGWQPGARDVLAKTSPHLVGWSELPEDVKEWDREPMRRIPQLLAGVGLQIRRLSD